VVMHGICASQIYQGTSSKDITVLTVPLVACSAVHSPVAPVCAQAASRTLGMRHVHVFGQADMQSTSEISMMSKTAPHPKVARSAPHSTIMQLVHISLHGQNSQQHRQHICLRQSTGLPYDAQHRTFTTKPTRCTVHLTHNHCCSQPFLLEWDRITMSSVRTCKAWQAVQYTHQTASKSMLGSSFTTC
jgi:hypothetical protein